MTWELLVGLRYLRSRRRHVPLSLISAISLAGVTIGVATLLIVLGVMTGMERDLRDKILGFNPHIKEPMRDILFDEKIAGSFHFTPGQAYETAGNGNKSAVHWDMVSIQRPEYGGGEIWFDGKLIRKDGLFTVPALKKLNPDQLLKQG